ncbi:MAG TPA: uroporphyrinogen decarboxylase [Roseiarcus sp.]|nr:uroporphyrinogen decarboxylase [Roseiarcus sp.]
MTDETALQRVFRGQSNPRPPIWLMRQAGRYLPEYRALRAKAPSFLEFCYDSELASEATLQPIRRFGFDAAILFSDILVVPDALGGKVAFEEGEGPRLAPVATADALAALRSEIDLDRLTPVFQTIRKVKAKLPQGTALLGFCGAPWTVASYMVAGRGVADQAPARLLAYRDPLLFQALTDRLVDASIVYLNAQIEAGVDAVQIFDSWAGILPSGEFRKWCLAPLGRIVAGVKRLWPRIPVIAFPRGANQHLHEVARATGADAIGLDTSTDLALAADLQRLKPVQGNLDPLVLLAGGAALDRAADDILAALGGGPLIFNLGHGILPQTPIAHVERLIRRVRGP